MARSLLSLLTLSLALAPLAPLPALAPQGAGAVHAGSEWTDRLLAEQPGAARCICAPPRRGCPRRAHLVGLALLVRRQAQALRGVDLVHGGLDLRRERVGDGDARSGTEARRVRARRGRRVGAGKCHTHTRGRSSTRAVSASRRDAKRALQAVVHTRRHPRLADGGAHLSGGLDVGHQHVQHLVGAAVGGRERGGAASRQLGRRIGDAFAEAMTRRGCPRPLRPPSALLHTPGSRTLSCSSAAPPSRCEQCPPWLQAGCGQAGTLEVETRQETWACRLRLCPCKVCRCCVASCISSATAFKSCLQRCKAVHR